MRRAFVYLHATHSKAVNRIRIILKGAVLRFHAKEIKSS